MWFPRAGILQFHTQALKFSKAGVTNLRRAAFTAFPGVLFRYPDQRLNIVKNMCICICLTACRLYMNYRCCQIKPQWNIFTQIGNCAKCSLDILPLGRQLGVTRRITDTGQNVSPSSLPTRSSSCHSYFDIFSLPHSSRTLLKYYTISILWLNYTVIKRNNNAIINNNYRRFQDLILLFKISVSTRKNFFEIYINFG